MNHLLVTTLLYSVHGRILTPKHSEIIRPRLQEKVLKYDINSPYQLALDYQTNTLFFSYTILGYHEEDVFKSSFLNLDTNEYGTIAGIAGGFANTVDYKNHIVYLGGRDGIYEYDYVNKRAVHIGGTDHNVWQMFYKDGLYYTTYPEEEIYIYKNGVSYRVPELANTNALLIGVSNNGNMFFANSSGLYLCKNSRIYNLGEYNINGMTSDIDGCLYFSTPEGIYYIDEDRRLITLVTKRDDVYGLVIEADQSIIYATDDRILRLQQMKNKLSPVEYYNSYLANNKL